MPNYCLGFGISAAILKFYCPEIKIISKPGGAGGQISGGFASLKNLFVNEWTRKLLKDLELEPKVIDSKFGFFVNGEVTKDVSRELKEMLLSKKLNEADSKKNFDLKDKDVNFGAGDGYNKIYDISFQQLFNAIKSKINMKDVISGDVMLISTGRQTLVTKDFQKFAFDKLVSTIAAPDFRYFAYDLDMPRNFKYIPKTYVMCSAPPIVLRKAFEEYDLIYLIDRFKFNRITKANAVFTYEITGAFSRDELSSMLDSDVEIINHFVQRIGLIMSPPLEDNVGKHIFYLGRLAEFKHDIRVEHVCEKIVTKLIKEFR